MGLSQALASAMSGLRANQIALGIVSSNVANAETAGYIRKTSNQVAVSSGEFGSSVRVAGINRELDQYLQRQLRTEMAGAAYATTRSDFLEQLQSVYGTPGSAGTLESTFNALTNAVQALSTSPDSQSARIAVINAAKALVQQLNSMTRGIQTLRSNAEAGLSGAVNIANNAMAQIADINVQLLRGGLTDGAAAELLDQRDRYIGQLSELMDIRVISNDDGQVNVFTTSGVQLVGGAEASQFTFDAQGTVTPNTLWSSNPSLSNMGTITVNFPHGGSMDLFASNAFRSGKIAALVELRDDTLVQAQTQLDEFAAALSRALSDQTVDGTAATSGAQAGFDIDLGALQNGNVVTLLYTDTTTNTQHKISILRVNDPSVLPLSNSATNDPNDEVIGIDFSGGMASVVTQLNAALGGANLSFSVAGSTLRVLDDGATGLSNVDAVSATVTVASVTGADPQLPLFNDGGNLYSGAFLTTGAQVQGFAGRIALNMTIANDPSKLVQYLPTTPSGDTTRPDFIYAQLTGGSYYYSAQAGLGTTTAPFKGSLLNFTQQFVSAQGEAASAAELLAEGQSVVVSTLQEKFASNSGVNIDDEMAHLLALQNAYAANARVMSVVKDMYQALMQVL